ncbi:MULTISPECIES: hypothetical protein [Cellulophaga]|nr:MULTISPECIES: hypothetical protein [Cellulophaga]MDO6769132.1 hypothetical protein [Cellulophaga sp. 1_MG-2023]
MKDDTKKHMTDHINIKRFLISILITLAFFLVAISASTLVNSFF